MVMERLPDGGAVFRGLRYNFADGTAREIVRCYSEAELWGNNALMQELLSAPKGLGAAVAYIGPEFDAEYRSLANPAGVFFDRLATIAAKAMLAYSNAR